MLASLRGGNPYREQPTWILQRLQSAVVITVESAEGSAVKGRVTGKGFSIGACEVSVPRRGEPDGRVCVI